MFSRGGDTKVGKISKQWSGFVREAFTDADMFGISFPIDLDVKIKAVLLGACFLIVSIAITKFYLSILDKLNFKSFFVEIVYRTSCSSKNLAIRNMTVQACCKVSQME